MFVIFIIANHDIFHWTHEYLYNPEDPIEVAAYDTYIDDDNDGFYGCWGAYPFAENDYIYASDMQYGLFVFDYEPVYAGWSEGYIYNDEGTVLSNLEMRSLLNNKVFLTDSNGYYKFGFSQGVQDFEFSINKLILLECAILVHPTILLGS